MLFWCITEKRIYRVEEERLVGRDKSCSISLDNAGASREHLRIRIRDTDVFIKDLGTKNGTKVDGERLSPHEEKQLCYFTILDISGQYYVLLPDNVSLLDSKTVTKKMTQFNEFLPVDVERKPVGLFHTVLPRFERSKRLEELRLESLEIEESINSIRLASNEKKESIESHAKSEVQKINDQLEEDLLSLERLTEEEITPSLDKLKELREEQVKLEGIEDISHEDNEEVKLELMS